MHIILATGMVVEVQPRRTVYEMPTVGLIVHAYHPGYSRKHKIGGPWSGLAWAKSKTYLQNSQRKKKRLRCG
jgi:hypothetical protein